MTGAEHQAIAARLEQGFAVDTSKGLLNAHIFGLETPLPVLRVSPLHIVCDCEGEQLTAGQEVSISLSYSTALRPIGPIAGVVEQVRIHEVKKQLQVQLRFTDLTPEARRSLFSRVQGLLISRYLLPGGSTSYRGQTTADDSRIRAIARSLIANATMGHARPVSGSTSLKRVRAARLEKESSMPLHWWLDTPWPDTPFYLELSSHGAVYQILVEDFEDVDGFLATPVPRKITRFRRRHARRVQASGMVVSFRHPDFDDVSISRPIVNLCQEGLAFSTMLADDLVYPGLVLPAIAVSAGKTSALIRGVVRHISVDSQSSEIVCGIQITQDNPFHPLVGWAHIAESVLRSTTRRGDLELIDELWELLDKSGYFFLSGKAPEDFMPMKERFSVVSGRYCDTPRVGCQVLCRTLGRMEATASVSKLYSGTWIFYQLARRRGRSPRGVSGRQLVRDVYVHAFEHTQWDPQLRWILTYIEGNVRWHHQTHLPFAEQHAATGYVLAVPFRLMECKAHKGPYHPSSDVEIHRATPDELALFFAHVNQQYPPALSDALDLVPTRFDLQSLNQSLQKAGLRRERELFVASQSGRAIAAALYETGTDGMHLFRLYDGARLWTFESGADDALLALMHHAAWWYGEKGKEAFVFFIDEDQLEIARANGLTDLGEGYQWLCHRSLIPDFLEHIYRHTAPRDVPSLL